MLLQAWYNMALALREQVANQEEGRHESPSLQTLTEEKLADGRGQRLAFHLKKSLTITIITSQRKIVWNGM